MICCQQCRGACYQLHSWRYLVNLVLYQSQRCQNYFSKAPGCRTFTKDILTATFFNRIFTYYHFITFLIQDIKFDLDFYRRALLLKLKASTTALKLFLSKAKASELFYPKQRPLNFLIQSKGDRTFFYPNQRLLNFFIQSKGFCLF